MKKYLGLKSLKLNTTEVSSCLFFISVMSFPRAYVEVKLIFLIIFIVFHGKLFLIFENIRLNKRILYFYLIIIIFGIFWTVVGLYKGTIFDGILADFKLYVIWSLAFLFIFIILYKENFFYVLHYSILSSGILIPLLNLPVIFAPLNMLKFFPTSYFEQMSMRIGFHEGYVQITSHNIGSLFLIVPYLISLVMHKDFSIKSNKVTLVSLFLSLSLVLVSGRRALWIVVMITPFVAIGFSLISRSFCNIRFRKTLSVLFIICISIGLIVFSSNHSSIIADKSTLNYFSEGFSGKNVRVLQASSLLEGFTESPILGSGFGAPAEYVRDGKGGGPWLYELTYHQMLYNLGILGIVPLCFLFLYYFYLAIKNIKLNKHDGIILFCILIGLFGIMIGSSTNPYLKSFDFLILLGFLPLCSSASQKNLWN